MPGSGAHAGSKTAVVEMAEAKGRLSQAALVQRLIRNAAHKCGIWPPDKYWTAAQYIQEVR
jgi:hypothetical protein